MTIDDTLRSLPERITRRIVADRNGCWIWTGAKSAGGYGQVALDGTVQYLHRIAWAAVNGPIPDNGPSPHGWCVLHDCDNRPCCNPDHLFLGSNQDNVTDMMKKGRNRHLRGAATGRALLSEIDTIATRQLWATGLYFERELAELLGVHRGTVSAIVNRRSWKHIPADAVGPWDQVGA